MFSYCAVGLTAGWPDPVMLEWNFSMQALSFFSSFTFKFKKGYAAWIEAVWLAGYQVTLSLRYALISFKRQSLLDRHSRQSNCDKPWGPMWLAGFPYSGAPGTGHATLKKCIILRVPSKPIMGSKKFRLISWNIFNFWLYEKAENISWNRMGALNRVPLKSSSKTLNETS